MRVLAELEALPGGGTRLTYTVAALPASLLGVVAIPIQIGFQSRRVFGKVFRAYGERVARRGVAVAEAVPSRPGRSASAGRLSVMASALDEAGVDERVARALTDHIASADDSSLSRLRPYVLADLWGAPRRSVLEACLHATRSGQLGLRWDVLCPLCRGVKETSESLRELRSRGVHCDTCLVDFSGDFQSSVELTFRVSPAVRVVEEMAFCVAGPQITPHVVAQQLLEAGEARELRPRLAPGSYRVRRHGRGEGVAVRVAEDAPTGPSELRLTADGWSIAEAELATEPVLRLANDTSDAALVVLERTGWGDDAVTAAEVTRLQTFRDLFSGECLRVGEFVEVGTLAVLFTDLKGSTRLYRDAGDAPAFGRVMEHFDVLRAAVTARDGTIVKTIGDAIMAVFVTPEAALAAALEAGRSLGAGAAGDPPLVLKAGVHVGPCLTVTLNGQLDYFGTTVNVAARLGDLSRGGDIVVSEAVLADPEVEAVIVSEALGREPVDAVIRGLEDDAMGLWRLTPADSQGRKAGA
jgi:class 3 adenylate cyclase